MAKELDCKKVAQGIKDEVKKEIAENSLDLTLAVVLVGNDSASEVYVRNKEKVSAEVGIHSEVHRLPEDATQEELNGVYQQIDNLTIMLNQLMIQRNNDYNTQNNNQNNNNSNQNQNQNSNKKGGN